MSRNPRAAVIPPIDYASHPAYGQLFPDPGLRTRAKAISQWAKGLVRVGQEATELGIRVARDRALRRRAHVDESAGPLLSQLRDQGAVPLELSSDERDELRRAMDEYVAQLQDERHGKEDGARKFKDNQLPLPTDSDMYALVTRILDRRNIYDVASAYLGYIVPKCVRALTLQINGPTDLSFWAKGFDDIGMPYPDTTYMHIDSNLGSLKCLIYLTDVGQDNGPFRYILGSNRRTFRERAVRKANDISGLDQRNADNRRLFAALPAALQRKAAFGYDMVADDPEIDTLLAGEQLFTSDKGHLILFDGDRGIHRGAMVHSGERHMLQVIIY